MADTGQYVVDFPLLRVEVVSIAGGNHVQPGERLEPWLQQLPAA